MIRIVTLSSTSSMPHVSSPLVIYNSFHSFGKINIKERVKGIIYRFSDIKKSSGVTNFPYRVA